MNTIMKAVASTLIDYSQFPSLITSSSELTPGLVCWHVYGHLEKEPKEYTIKGVFYWRDTLAFKYQYGRFNMHAYCDDCGLDGANQNNNRLFKDREDAVRFIEECEKNGIYTGFEPRHDYY